VNSINSDIFIIAEAGVNHNGDVGLAKKLVDAAVEAGANAVKFQHFNPDKVVRDEADMADYQKKNVGSTQSQKNLLAELVLSPESFIELKQYTTAKNIEFLCTAFDMASAIEIIDLVPAWKVSSTDLMNFPFLEDLCGTGKPLILSSGMATHDEVIEASQFVAARATGSDMFAPVSLLHCVSSYPAPMSQVNLKVIPALSEELNIPVGYSDHTLGIGAAIGAASLGASIIEKHLTLDRNLPGPDHQASLEPIEFGLMVKTIRDVELALGSSIKEPQECELEHRISVRRSLHAAKDLQAGESLTSEDLIALRPADGIEPNRLKDIIGRKLKHDISTGTPIKENDLTND
jgi:sialic acid synthase SpsE